MASSRPFMSEVPVLFDLLVLVKGYVSSVEFHLGTLQHADHLVVVGIAGASVLLKVAEDKCGNGVIELTWGFERVARLSGAAPPLVVRDVWHGSEEFVLVAA